MSTSKIRTVLYPLWVMGLLFLAGCGVAQASPWTEGQKRLLFIRVDFPDLAGAPFSDLTGSNLVNNLNSFYSEMSYGRASFALAGTGSEITPTFRMPQPGAWYGTNNNYNQLRTDARNAAANAGYILTNYDLDITCMTNVLGWSWSGMGFTGIPGAWLRNSFNVGAAAHELGHNFGLGHANYWDTGGQSTIGPGTSMEQGDYWDTMGWALAGNNHFNAHSKYLFNWLTTNDVAVVTNSGTYRISALDDSASSGLRALSIAKNSSTNYWVEFRQKPINRWVTNGAVVHWAQSGNQRTHLLDTTPGSPDGENDSALVIGRTFSDLQAGVHITPVGKAATVPESLNVVVNLGPFPTNLSPTVAINASNTSAAIGSNLTFTATATDPNSDALAYYWDFGDATFGTNASVAVKSWNTAGEYNVRCLVTDMKGGLASASVVVRVGSVSTYRISGVVTAGGSPVVNARIYVSSSKVTYTDTDGSYNLVGLAAGPYTVNANLYGYAFSANGFSNPVTVGPNATNISFTSPLTNPPSITTQPSNAVVVAGQSATFSISATGTAPLTYQWLFKGAGIAGATAVAYARTNVQLSDAGSYSVRVSNSVGVALSSNALLTIISPPTITNQPLSQSRPLGADASFAVGVNGTPPLSYQWFFNGQPVSGATQGGYVRSNIQPADAGVYSVQVTNAAGATLSSNATLTVLEPPRVTLEPRSQSVAAASEVTFTVLATGAATLGYQWRFNGSEIGGATTSSYTKTNVQSSDAGEYMVEINNEVGTAWSSPAILTVNNPPVLATLDDQTIHAGTSLILTNRASDSDIPTQALTFTLASGPADAAIDATNGIFQWTPGLDLANSTNYITVSVNDDGTPSLNDAKTFVVRVVPSLSISSINLSNGMVTIGWGSIPGKTYRVEYRDGLESVAWSSLLPDITALASNISITEPILAGSRFYRVRLQ